MELTHLRVRQTPGRQGIVIVEPNDGDSKLKVEVRPSTIDEITGKTNLSHDERMSFVESNLDTIKKIASEKFRSGKIEERSNHGRPFAWISIEPQDFLHLRPK